MQPWLELTNLPLPTPLLARVNALTTFGYSPVLSLPDLGSKDNLFLRARRSVGARFYEPLSLE